MKTQKTDLSIIYSTQVAFFLETFSKNHSIKTDVNLTLKKLEKMQNQLKRDILANHYTNLVKTKAFQMRLDEKNRPKSKSFISSHEKSINKNFLPFIVEVFFFETFNLYKKNEMGRIIGVKSDRLYQIAIIQGQKAF